MNTKAVVRALKKRLSWPKPISSRDYWLKRYESGGSSGHGSYGRLARFKAAVLNEFVRSNNIACVLEFGCGDGNQLLLAEYPQYMGYDLSPVAVELCRDKFAKDDTKTFSRMSDYDGGAAELALSLDVIFHLIEDRVFEDYLGLLFGASSRFVIIYSSNQNLPIEKKSPHVRHRCFTDWIEANLASHWHLARRIPNAYPYENDDGMTSRADFYIYYKTTGG